MTNSTSCAWNGIGPVRILSGLAILAATSCRVTAGYEPSAVPPPALPREFRGAWVATVANIDWPSSPGLAVAGQKSGLLAILDHAAELKLNAIIFQVRPACDAMYASTLEPWSEFLTGAMGAAPEPFYDPLAFAVAEAHRRGLELHAWFNPYRAHHFQSKSPISSNHISRTRPDLVRAYGRYLWLDPGERDVQEYSLRVVLDVVKRYDVDAVHFDDYFYPYAEKGGDGQELPFPDDASWRKYGVNSGLSRDDWRRENVNQFVERVHMAVKAAKPGVKFGISPFGIWRPGHPPSVKGYDAYDKLYADARKWLHNGWVDYFVPQLYWAIDSKEQSYSALLDWWDGQNPEKRHIWPGMNTVRVSEQKWQPSEILQQIQLARKQPVSAGHAHYSMKHLQNNAALTRALLGGPYDGPALIPAMPWFGKTPPTRPRIKVASKQPLQINWTPGEGEQARWWLLQYKTVSGWRAEILPADQRARNFKGADPEVIALTAISRAGITGPGAVIAQTR
jgi:uncharacterized lipoprotein YddW (UPF0748 family)